VEKGFLIGHIIQVIHNVAILLFWKLGFEIICAEPLDNFCIMLQKPGTTLPMRQLEYGIIIVLLLELQGMVVDFMNRLSKLRMHSDNPTRVIHVYTLYHCESSILAAATMRSLTDGEVCTSLATMV
jgi:hypothetical protein